MRPTIGITGATGAPLGANARSELQGSRDELAALAEQQAALRRVATLVARAASPSEVFSVVAEEMARCLKVANAEVCRYQENGAGIVAVRSFAAATSRAALIESRRRIVAAADETRRRLERNLHDGAQQRAVSLGLQLRTAESFVPSELGALRDLLSLIGSGLTELCEELREISHGMHPAIVSTGGLGPALKSLARRSTIPVTLDLAVQRRLPEVVEVAAYYVVAEAFTNAAKHAHASQLALMANADDENLHLLVRDDGNGGAAFDKGSGLIGLKDRVEALGGQLTLSSTVEKGTSLTATLPLRGR